VKLFYNPPSPYARKVLVVAHERDLIGRMKLVATDPWKDPADLIAAAPLAKVPALELDEGLVITESTVICSYLDHIHRPASAGTDADLMARAGLAQGLVDAAFAIVIERRRPPDRQWQAWIDRQRRAIERALPRFSVRTGRFDLADVTLACGLGYLDFRLPEVDWRKNHAELANWFDEVSRRPSMKATTP
jgi:glutathione S-transferase